MGNSFCKNDSSSYQFNLVRVIDKPIFVDSYDSYNSYDSLLEDIHTADDKQIHCELIKDINGYINKKWSGVPFTVQEIEQVFGSQS
jgi:hypothetical protein